MPGKSSEGKGISREILLREPERGRGYTRIFKHMVPYMQIMSELILSGRPTLLLALRKLAHCHDQTFTLYSKR